MPVPLFQIDAFTSEMFAGNPVGICFLPAVRDDAWMQNVAREMNLAETAFLVPQADGFELRWFTPSVEVDLCGHATLASAHALWETGWLSRTETARFHTKSGVLTADAMGDVQSERCRVNQVFLHKICLYSIGGNKEANVVSDVQLIRCPACGVTNRFVQEKIDQGLQPICGRCKTPVPVDNRPVTVTDATFLAQVERSPLPVLVDMWAAWCGPCQMIAPVLDELAAEMAGRVRFAKLNVDDNPATAERFGVRSIPTLLILSEGKEIDRIVGVQPKSEIARRLEQVLSLQRARGKGR